MDKFIMESIDSESESKHLSLCDIFLGEISKSIDSGNITYIKNAIKNYESNIDKSYITWANFIALQIIEENLESMFI
jgi:hypothetical protein